MKQMCCNQVYIQSIGNILQNLQLLPLRNTGLEYNKQYMTHDIANSVQPLWVLRTHPQNFWHLKPPHHFDPLYHITLRKDTIHPWLSSITHLSLSPPKFSPHGTVNPKNSQPRSWLRTRFAQMPLYETPFPSNLTTSLRSPAFYHMDRSPLQSCPGRTSPLWPRPVSYHTPP